MKTYRGVRRALSSAKIGGKLVARKIRDAFSRYQWFLGYKFGQSADMPGTF